MPLYADRVKMSVSGTPGTGTVELGSASSGFQSFADGFPNRPCLVGYAIEDGTAWEVGKGTLNSTGTQITRDVVRSSSNAGNPINATSAAVIFCTPSAEQIDNANIGLQLAQIRGYAMP